MGRLALCSVTQASEACSPAWLSPHLLLVCRFRSAWMSAASATCTSRWTCTSRGSSWRGTTSTSVRRPARRQDQSASCCLSATSGCVCTSFAWDLFRHVACWQGLQAEPDLPATVPALWQWPELCIALLSVRGRGMTMLCSPCTAYTEWAWVHICCGAAGGCCQAQLLQDAAPHPCDSPQAL